MEELIKGAIKTLNENPGFNEVTLNDGKNTVHLVRFTPAPTVYYPSPWDYNQHSPQP